MTYPVQTQRAVELRPEVLADLHALQERSERFQRTALRLIWATVGAGALSAIGAGLAWWLAPDAALKSVHLPNEIVSLFVAATPGSGGPLLSDTFRTTPEFLFSVVKPAMMLFGFGISVLGLFKAYSASERQEEAAFAFAPIIFGPVLVLMPYLLSAMLGIGDGASAPSASEVPQQDFVMKVEAADYAGVQAALQGVRAPEAAKNYVLPQMALLKAQKTVKPLSAAARTTLASQVTRLDEALAKGVRFTPQPQTLYALELAALDKTQSTLATDYLTESSRSMRWARSTQYIAGFLAFLAGISGVGMLIVSQRIRARLERIQPFLDLKANAEKAAPEKPFRGPVPLSAPKVLPPDWEPAWKRMSGEPEPVGLNPLRRAYASESADHFSATKMRRIAPQGPEETSSADIVADVLVGVATAAVVTSFLQGSTDSCVVDVGGGDSLDVCSGD